MIGAMVEGRVDSPAPNSAVATALAATGLEPRGWLVPEETSAPLLKSGKPAQAICLVGHGGGDFWPVFDAWYDMHRGSADPLDTWSKAVLNPIAARLGGEAVYPSDQPWQPFQQWAMAAEGLKPSPLGLLIHPCYGLWHGYRGAILFGEAWGGDALGMPANPLDVNEAGYLPIEMVIHPCDTCSDKPCLSACPVGAFSLAGFAVAACRSHVRTSTGLEGCMKSGCLARDACPVGREYRYGADQIRFHMAAFG